MGKINKITERRNVGCAACGRIAAIGYNRPKSLHRTKRLFKINLQYHQIKGQRLLVCTRCWKKLRQENQKSQENQAD